MCGGGGGGPGAGQAGLRIIPRKKVSTCTDLFCLVLSKGLCVASLSVYRSYARLPVRMADNVADETKVDQTGGGIEGPEATYVKLVASDGHEFIVRRDHALTSGTIKAMLSGPGEG